MTNFNENWRFENFIVSSQYTIKRKLFKQFSSCYMQTDLRKKKLMYKVVQIWPGLFTLVYIQIIPGHNWTTLYFCTCSLRTYQHLMESLIPETYWHWRLSTSLSFENSVHIKNCVLATPSVVVLKGLLCNFLCQSNYRRMFKHS